jgi:Fe-S oxidoreductase
MQDKSNHVRFLSQEERTETIWACRFCMMCHVADRVTRVMKRESYSPRGRSAILEAIEKGFLDWDSAVGDIMYTTLNDGLLREWCVGNYDHEELIIDARSRILERGAAPEEVTAYLKSMHASQGRSNDPNRILTEADVKMSPGAKVLLFAGCTARDSEQNTLIVTGRLFNHAGVEFQVLSGEPCCGWPLYQLGDLAGAGEFSIRIAEEIRKSGATSVAVLDGDCYRMLLTRTARFGGDLKGVKVLHVSQIAAEWIKEGRIRIENKIAERVTYHDPCALARYCDDTESARSVLAAVLEHEVAEMGDNRKLSQCCGAGGMLNVHRPDVDATGP